MGMTAIETLTRAPMAEIARSLRRRTVSPLELVDAYSRRIDEAGGLHAFITVPGERARREAPRAGRPPSPGGPRALPGVPHALKDLFAPPAGGTTAGGGHPSGPGS